MLVLVLTILLGPSGADVRADFKYTFDEIIGLMVWAWVVCSPHMNMFFALLQVNYLEFMRIFMSDFPGVADCVAIAFAQSVVALGGAYALDRIAVRSLEFADAPAPGPLDARVRIERERVLELDPRANAHGAGGNALVMKELRKVYRPERPGAPPTVACANMCAGVAQGEIFGLLGANGAGKTTAISCVMRSLYPTTGDIQVCGDRVLSHSKGASRHLVTLPVLRTLLPGARTFPAEGPCLGAREQPAIGPCFSEERRIAEPWLADAPHPNVQIAPVRAQLRLRLHLQSGPHRREALRGKTT